jgi:type I restriction enzyme S subunit
MASEWTETTLGEVADLRNGAGIKQVEYSKIGIPLVRVSNFTSHSISMNDCLFVNKLHSRKWSEHRLREGDLLVATVGSWPPNWSSVVGKVVRVPREASGALQNQNTCAILAKPSKADQRFLFYRLKTEDFAHYAANAAAGSANQARLPVTKLGKFLFHLPHIDEQREIAATLGSLDDQIQLLQGQNETLEAIARAIFKSWFVDFDPVRAKAEGREPEGMDAATAGLFPSEFDDSELGPIPKGWQAKFIGELAEIVGGSTPSTTNVSYWEDGEHFWATPKDLSSNNSPVLLGTERKVTTQGLASISSGLLPVGTVLLSSRAPIGYLALTRVPTAINQGFIAMKPLEKVPNVFLLLWTEHAMDTIKSLANGSTFQKISKRNFRTIRLVRPDGATLSAFDSLTQSLYERITVNAKQIQTLAELRDTLLPRLISGKLRVPDAETMMEAVL